MTAVETSSGPKPRGVSLDSGAFALLFSPLRSLVALLSCLLPSLSRANSDYTTKLSSCSPISCVSVGQDDTADVPNSGIRAPSLWATTDAPEICKSKSAQAYSVLFDRCHAIAWSLAYRELHATGGRRSLAAIPQEPRGSYSRRGLFKRRRPCAGCAIHRRRGDPLHVRSALGSSSLQLQIKPGADGRRRHEPQAIGHPGGLLQMLGRCVRGRYTGGGDSGGD